MLEALVSKHRDKKAALKLLGKPRKRHGRAKELVTDERWFYGAALKDIGPEERHATERCENKGAESSYLPFRRPGSPMHRFRRLLDLQVFPTKRSSVLNHLKSGRSFSSG